MIHRRYSPRDLLQHEYVECILQGTGVEWSGARFEENGPLELDDRIHESCCPGDDFNRHHVSIATVPNRIIVVREKVKKFAEREGLKRIVFRPTVLTDWYRNTQQPYDSRKQISWESIGEEPWWELFSDLRLPRVHPSLELVDNDGSPYIYGVSKGCTANEGFFAYPELHYRDSEIRALEPFDCALTYEHFGGSTREENLIRVISRRFYERLLRNFVRVKAVPVRLVPD